MAIYVLKCSHVSQAGRPFVRGLPAVTICNLKALCRYHLLQMGSILACNSVCVPLERKTRLRDMQKIRLGHSSLFCVCLPMPRTLHTPLQCFLDFECAFFAVSALHVGWRIVFFMSQMSNVNGIEQHAQLSP